MTRNQSIIQRSSHKAKGTSRGVAEIIWNNLLAMESIVQYSTYLFSMKEWEDSSVAVKIIPLNLSQVM